MSADPVHGPDEPLDAADLRILADVARVAAIVDPVPEGLAERSLFAVTLAGLVAEVMELEYAVAPETSVRGESQPVEARTVTFTSAELTVMISLSATDDGRVRIDGYASPAGVLTVELHRPGSVATTHSDDDGRFVFEAVEPGPGSLVVRQGDGRAVSTPVIEL